MVLKGRPARKPPTVGKEGREGRGESSHYGGTAGRHGGKWRLGYHSPLAMSPTMAWEVPHRLGGALSFAMTPNKAMGP